MIAVLTAAFASTGRAHEAEGLSALSSDSIFPNAKNWVLSVGLSVAAAAGVTAGWELLRRGSQRLVAKHTAELEENEERLKLALHASQMGVWEWDLASDRIYWSEECLRIFAAEKTPLTAAEFFGTVYAEDLPVLRHRAQLALEGDQAFQAEFRVQGPDGRLRWLANFGIAKRNKAGQALRLLGTVKDITDQRRISEELRESEEKFRQMAENIQQVFWMTSPSKDRMEYVSPAFQPIWGCAVKDL